MYSTLAVSDTDSTHQGHPGAIYANPGRDGRVGHACMQRLRRLQLSTPHNNHQIVLGIFRNAKVAIISCCIDQTTIEQELRQGERNTNGMKVYVRYYEGPVSYFVGFFSASRGIPGKILEIPAAKSRISRSGNPGTIPGLSRRQADPVPFPSRAIPGSRDNTLIFMLLSSIVIVDRSQIYIIIC